ncbi:MAG: c-type cytochrome [Gammaproteobacteria bacterium]|nr:c-type cytochrome [Gammaproteobacteria bacterium]
MIKSIMPRIAAAIVSVVIIIGGGFAAYVYVLSERIVHRQYEAPLQVVAVPTNAAAIVEGERLAAIRGCSGCHGKNLAGAVFFDDFKQGRATAPNLTSAVRDYSVAELARVIRHGVRHNGEGVQIMPSPMYYHLSDADLGKIIAYLRSLPRADGLDYEFRPGPATRWLMVRGIWAPWPETVQQLGPRLTIDDQSDPIARGEYLALTSCSECHGQDLAGNPAFGIPPLPVMAAAYTPEQFDRFLSEGVAIGDRELPMMSRVARSRFSHLHPEERGAIYQYLIATD